MGTKVATPANRAHVRMRHCGGTRLRRLVLATAALSAAVLLHPARPTGATVSERSGGMQVLGQADERPLPLEPYRLPPEALQIVPGPGGPAISLSTYLGSDFADAIVAVEADGLGNLFVFGTVPDAKTSLSFFPTDFFGPEPHASPTQDCFLAKLSPDPPLDRFAPWYVALIHDSERCDAMTVAPTGEVSVARTTVDGAVIIEQFSDAAGGVTRTNSFVVPQIARVTHLRVDDSGNTAIVGECANEANPGDLWPLPNGYDIRPYGLGSSVPCTDTSLPGQPGGQYLMVKIGSLGQVLYGSFFGFSVDQITPNSVEIDALGRVYIAGDTHVSGPTILHTFNAFLLQPGDAFCDPAGPECQPRDAFLIVFDPRFADDASYHYASYLGGSGEESDVAMALDRGTGRVHLVGNTRSKTTFLDTPFAAAGAMYEFVIDVDQPPATQLVRSGTIDESSGASFLSADRSRARFGRRSDGTYALLAVPNGAPPLVNAIYSAPRDPNASVDMMPLLFVYDPAADDLIFSTFLDDVTLAHSAHLASVPSGALYVAMLTTESNRSFSSAPMGGDDVLAFAIRGIAAATSNRAPFALAPADQVVEGSSPLGARVLLYGGFSFDPDGDPLTYTWSEGSTVLDSRADAQVELLFTLGQHVLTLTVDDGRGGTSSDTMILDVIPNTPAGGPLTLTPEDLGWRNSGVYNRFPMTVQFTDVTGTGFTSVTSRAPLPPAPPPGMQFGSPPHVYDLATTATFTGPLTVCIDYRGFSFPRPDTDLQMYQQVNGTWVPLPQTNDTSARQICGSMAALGTVGVFSPAVAANEISILAGQPGRSSACFPDPQLPAVQGPDPNEGGFATDSSLCVTRGLAYDAARNYLYFSEASAGDKIRRVDLTTRRITTVAGTGFSIGSLDGSGRGDPRDDDKNNVDPLTAPINEALDIALDAAGNLLFAEYGFNAGRIRKVDFAQNLIFTVADVSAFSHPSALAIDASGAVLFAGFADSPSHVWRLSPGADGVLNGSPDEVLQIVAGTGVNFFDPASIPAGGANPLSIGTPTGGLAFGADGSLYVTVQLGMPSLLRITPGPDGLVDGNGDTAFLVTSSGFATGPIMGDGDPVTSARLFSPWSVTVAPNGDVYVGDGGHFQASTVRRITAGSDGVVTGAADEIISTVAGFHIFDPNINNSLELPYSDGDGHALSSIFGAAWNLEVLPNGDLLITDSFQVRRVGPRSGAGSSLVIQTPAVPNAIEGSPYSAAITAAGGSGAGYTWFISSGALPAGLAIAQTGTPSTSLSGVPTANGTFNFTIDVNDSGGNTATQAFTLVVHAPLIVQTPTVATATEGTPYSAAITAAGGTGVGYTWSVSAGALPAGLTLAQAGTPTTTISGTPTANGTFEFTVSVTDSAANTGTRAFTLVVNSPLIIHTATVANATEGAPYSATITAAGGTGVGYTWLISAGALPAGLTLAQTGTPSTTIAGTPTEDGTFNFTVTVIDSAGTTGTRAFTFAVDPQAVAIVTVTERIVVRDTPVVRPSAMVGVSERIAVADTLVLRPSAWIGVSERIAVHDAAGVVPPAVVTVIERIAVADTPRLLPSALIGVAERIVVRDGPQVTAIDDVAPVLTVPGTIVAEAQTPAGAVVTFAATATDNTPGIVNVACSPQSGSLFAFNGSSPTTTAVTCVATDAAGNTANGTFDVVVQDTTAPVVNVAHVTVAATEPGGARGNVPQAPHTPILQALPLMAAATDAADPAPTRLSVHWVSCGDPAQVLGPVADTTLYPVGTNCISYVFRDGSGNAARGVGTLQVSPPIGGFILAANVPVVATDLNNVPVPVTATFLTLDQPGLLTAVPPQFVPPPPAGFTLVGAPLDIRSTALAPAAVGVCMQPPVGQFAERLFLLDNFQWVDRTDTVNPVTGEICGHPAPVGTVVLAKPDLPPLSLAISPPTATAPIEHGHVVEMTVVDQSNPHSRVTFIGYSPLTVEFRDPAAPNSPLSVAPQYDQMGTFSGLIVSLGTNAGGQLISTAREVADLVHQQAIAWPGAGAISVGTWPGTNGAGIVAPLPPQRLARLSLIRPTNPGVECYISLPGRCLFHILANSGPRDEVVTAHLDSNDDGVVDAGELVAHAGITWVDTLGPILTLPVGISVPATSPAGAAVTFVVSAVDAIDGPIAPSCAPPSGATFPVGATTVICTATDASGNQTTGGFTVSVAPFVPPATPLITSLSPSTAVAGGADILVKVTGSGFSSGATAFWNGVSRPTVVDDATQVTMTVLASDLATTADLTTVHVTVGNLATPASNALPFVITSPQVVTVDAAIALPGGIATATNAPTTPGRQGVSATLTNNNPASAPATVAVASYATNPVGDATFAAGGFFDIQVTGADASDSLTAQFYYPTTVTGFSEVLLQLLYWNGSAWAPVVGAGGSPPFKDTNDNLDGTTSGGRFTVTLDSSSIPRITDLGGTVFALVEEDRIAPVTMVGQSPAANAAGWNKTDVTVTLAAADEGSGVARTEFAVNGGSWRPYVGPIAVDHDGIYTLQYRSVDEAGNVERTKTARVRIDKTEPLAIAVALPTLLLPANRRMVDVTVLLLALDLLSGVEKLTLRSVTSDDPGMTSDDVAGWTIGTKDTRGKLRAERTATGGRRVYTLTYRVTDRAGNEAEAVAVVVVPGARD